MSHVIAYPVEVLPLRLKGAGGGPQSRKHGGFREDKAHRVIEVQAFFQSQFGVVIPLLGVNLLCVGLSLLRQFLKPPRTQVRACQLDQSSLKGQEVRQSNQVHRRSCDIRPRDNVLHVILVQDENELPITQ